MNPWRAFVRWSECSVRSIVLCQIALYNMQSRGTRTSEIVSRSTPSRKDFSCRLRRVTIDRAKSRRRPLCRLYDTTPVVNEQLRFR